MASPNLAHRILGSPVTGQSIPRRGPRLLAAGELNSGVDGYDSIDSGDPYGSEEDDYRGSPYAYMGSAASLAPPPGDNSGGGGDSSYPGASIQGREEANPALQSDPNRRPWDEVPPSPSNTRRTPLSRHSDSALTQPPPDNSQSDLHYFGDPYKDEVNPVDRYKKALANPPNPQSSWWRRLLGGVIDTAGTWGQGFGVPRGVTHHLAQDVRYGADQAHEAENYYRQLPLQGEAAKIHLNQQKLDQQDKEFQQRQAELSFYHQQMDATRQDNARSSALRASPGYQPLPSTAPPVSASAPLMQTPPRPARPTQAQVDPMGNLMPLDPGGNVPSDKPPLNIPITGDGMSSQQQIPEGYTQRNIPAGYGLPAESGMAPTPEYAKRQQAELEGKAMIDTPKFLRDEGYPAKLTPQEVTLATTAKLNREGKEPPNKNEVQAYIDAAGGDTKKGIEALHKDKMAEKSVNNFNFGTPGSGGVLDKITRSTPGGRQYVDGTGYTGKALNQLQGSAPQGIPVLNKEGVGTIQANGAVSQTLDDMMDQIKSKLPKDGTGRIITGPTNKLSQYFQTDADLAAFKSWNLNAVKMVRTMGANRLNRQEYETAKDSMPEITDTLATAERKVKTLKKMFQNAEDELFSGMKPKATESDPMGLR